MNVFICISHHQFPYTTIDHMSSPSSSSSSLSSSCNPNNACVNMTTQVRVTRNYILNNLLNDNNYKFVEFTIKNAQLFISSFFLIYNC